ncbi:unnamed protein product [Oppiella nova]|uniref:Uncharacterized protein n=1 Tax=Oppiella nova TaxID=334625 RepID=A0A7R9MQJ0_9ACAR|nr:unnamed protein product [Oppiella nova]CAD7664275.1 unnamed protein product [Oppiella nova]CAG2181230.1 unnamed protein product [Oppiella nova]CAG2181412.1 unnamed protein product [Oppiella nova]
MTYRIRLTVHPRISHRKLPST